VYHVLRKLKVTVTGDIGCYTLGALAPLSSLHTCLCMGAGITFFEGFSKVLGHGSVVGVIGDSTFFHSGITGLVSAAYNRTKGVIIILDNSTTAMTGSQPNPATGKTITGETTRQLSLESICLAAGADTVDVVNPLETKQLEEVVKRRLAGDTLSVIITRYPCRIIERNVQPGPEYHKEKCKKCGLCFSIDCPAIAKTEDGYVEINRSLCTGCMLCTDTCKPGALKNGK
jgi:indolepyruvate ferredoxin oxidoreductase alpha subunit